jgi:capsular exopolysaccharide synthesis family protein
LENTVGLSQLLTGQAADESVAYHAIEDGALTVLTSGKLPPNPLELLSAPKMEQLIEAWKQEYDYVLFDLPPVGEVADAIAMSKYVSGFLFVLRSGVSDIHRVREAITLLEERNAKIHGCVLTDVESEFMSYYYTYGNKRNKTTYA